MKALQWSLEFGAYRAEDKVEGWAHTHVVYSIERCRSQWRLTIFNVGTYANGDHYSHVVIGITRRTLRDAKAEAVQFRRVASDDYGVRDRVEETSTHTTGSTT